MWSIHHELRTSLRSQDLNLDSQSALLHSQVPAVTSPIFPEGTGDHPSERDPREMGWGKSLGLHPHPKRLPRFSARLTASPASFRGALGKASFPGISTSGWQSSPPQINPRGTLIGRPNQNQVVSACHRGGSPATEGSWPEDPGGGLRGARGVRKANMGLQDMVLSSSEFNSYRSWCLFWIQMDFKIRGGMKSGSVYCPDGEELHHCKQ